MARARLVANAVEKLTQDIVDGTYPPHRPLPSQSQLATDLGVSRLTVREALETLRAAHMVRIVHGRGTFVTPREEWTDIRAISRSVGVHDSDGVVARHVLEVRRMIEIGAAQSCAVRRSEEDLRDLADLLARMRTAHVAGDVADFVEADMAFHAVVLRGCHNPFLGVVYDPLMDVLRQTRTQTSAVATIREHAIDRHEAVLVAVRHGDPEEARAAMRDHMEQTEDDLHTHVLTP